MNLKDFQDAFLTQITQVTHETEEVNPLLQILNHDIRMTPQERLDIYVRDYRGRLFDVLKDHYPRTYTYLGENIFLELFSDFITQHPPSSYSLRYWGEYLADFCKQTLQFNQPELIDLISFEWTIHDLFDGEDSELLSLDSLSQVSTEKIFELRFEVIPCFKLSQAETNVTELWQALKEEKMINKQNEITNIVHWRKDCEVFFRELTQQEWQCLKRLSLGDTFGDLCESLTENLSDEDAPQVFSQYLQTWINDGMIQEALLD